MPSTRVARVARQVQQALSEIIETDLNDPRIGMITLTAVHMTPDLRSARVFFSCLGSVEERSSSAAALERATGFLRRELGSKLRLRHVPDLRFVIDDSLDLNDKIERLLQATRPDTDD
jgi:ribosome-binding factor A